MDRTVVNRWNIAVLVWDCTNCLVVVGFLVGLGDNMVDLVEFEHVLGSGMEVFFLIIEFVDVCR